MFFRSKKVPTVSTDIDRPTTVIGAGTYIEAARMTGSEGIHIDGVYKGDIDIESTLVLGETGTITGDVHSVYFAVAGEMRGNIRCETQLQFSPTSKVFGDVRTSSLVVYEGAQVNGRYLVGNAQTAPSHVAVEAGYGSQTIEAHGEEHN